MKNILGLTILTTALFSGSALCAEPGFYLGAKAGKATIDVDGLDSVNGNAFFAGYAFESGFAIEVEKGSYSSDNAITTADIDTTAIYAAARMGDDWFFKAKIGVLSEDVAVSMRDYFSYGEASTSDTGLSYGLGGGYQWKNAILELEYTLIDADVSAITLGVSYKF